MKTHTFKVVLLTLFVVMLTIHSLLLGTFPTYSCFTVIQPDSWTLSLYPSWPQSHGIHTCGCLCTHSNLWTPTHPKHMIQTKCTHCKKPTALNGREKVYNCSWFNGIFKGQHCRIDVFGALLYLWHDAPKTSIMVAHTWSVQCLNEEL